MRGRATKTTQTPSISFSVVRAADHYIQSIRVQAALSKQHTLDADIVQPTTSAVGRDHNKHNYTRRTQQETSTTPPLCGCGIVHDGGVDPQPHPANAASAASNIYIIILNVQPLALTRKKKTSVRLSRECAVISINIMHDSLNLTPRRGGPVRRRRTHS